MIKACSVTAMALVLSSTSAFAADPVPVIELQVQEGAANNFSSNSAANGDILQLLEQLQREVQSLRGMVEQQQHKIKRMERDSRDRYRDLDRRIADIQQGAPVANGSQTPATDTTLTDSSNTSGTEPATTTQVTDVEAYQAAFALVRNKDYDAALSAFDSFINTYPSSPRLANAYYWLGEVNLAQQNIEPAKQAFQYVVDNFAKHRKAADASYKLGVIYKQQGDVAQAKAYFEQTVAQYPGSSAANLAQDHLK
ncbi:tol-pal system protein YbgF [Aliamphritea ceti]|uniref:tol-pal system protein YbgF n=1 Tax=Aliamphritea ceti TaxID=1524258 RepID=UPI0021C46E9E|nr:tol-pal system protein YbgF [Aliamphritea ceti]